MLSYLWLQSVFSLLYSPFDAHSTHSASAYAFGLSAFHIVSHAKFNTYMYVHRYMRNSYRCTANSASAALFQLPFQSSNQEKSSSEVIKTNESIKFQFIHRHQRQYISNSIIQ